MDQTPQEFPLLCCTSAASWPPPLSVSQPTCSRYSCSAERTSVGTSSIHHFPPGGSPGGVQQAAEISWIFTLAPLTRGSSSSQCNEQVGCSLFHLKHGYKGDRPLSFKRLRSIKKSAVSTPRPAAFLKIQFVTSLQTTSLWPVRYLGMNWNLNVATLLSMYTRPCPPSSLNS